ncbi:hypothetical protein [Streptomyces triticagri]|uniref:hypothetical protein n=1 Tax=Streptomyces triticagri TaxID=2293568 RepID=UPI001313DAB4|nr:hypothetical protein [Streptomyces triticagri]
MVLGVSVAACGSGDEGAGGDGGSGGGTSKKPAAADKGGGEPSAPATDDAERTLTAAELEELFVTKADLTGPLKDYVVENPGPDEVETSDSMKASGSECQPLVDTLNEVAPAGASATERRAVMGPAAKRLEEGLGSQVALSSYKSEAAAAKALEALEVAVADCGDGFEATGAKAEDNQSFTRVDKERAPQGADQSVAYDLVGDLTDGEEVAEDLSTEMPMKFVYARSGSTVAMFLTYNPFDPAKTDFPTGLVDAQIAKLTGATA